MEPSIGSTSFHNKGSSDIPARNNRWLTLTRCYKIIFYDITLVTEVSWALTHGTVELWCPRATEDPPCIEADSREICRVMSRRKQRSAFDQVSEFDRGRIVAYRDYGLSFRKIGSRVGRNQTTVMRICERWMQEVSVRTIRRRLQQSDLSARCPLLGLPLTQNHRCLRRQWCDERRMWVAEWKEVVFTDEFRICLQHHDGRIRV
ncbi:transposable element Tcb1 transposase [Trichonephila clavipes]|nr:transposable element Tcb1 transposase [Trichonephila clavipes]